MIAHSKEGKDNCLCLNFSLVETVGDKKKLLVTASTFPRWEDDTEPRFVLNLCEAISEYFDIMIMDMCEVWV